MVAGLWGEDAAFQALQCRPDLTRVEWLNRHEETFLPYDIVAWTAEPEPRQLFYEVKTTVSPRQRMLNVSLAEVEAARRYGSLYHFVIVRYDKKKKAAKVVVLRNWLNATVRFQLALPQEIDLVHEAA